MIVTGREIGSVVAVSSDPSHGFSKTPRASITLVAGLGVEGDAHAGRTVQHLYRKRLDARAPNLAQVHFLPAELLEELEREGHVIAAGAMGENVLTRGLDLDAMPTSTLFTIGEALIEITGCRDPCRKIDRLGKGLAKRMVGRAPDGSLLRRAGIMGIVREGGTIHPGDTIVATMPALPHRRLEVV